MPDFVDELDLFHEYHPKLKFELLPGRQKLDIYQYFQKLTDFFSSLSFLLLDHQSDCLF